MEVPAPVKQLNKANAFFNKPSGQQAVVRKAGFARFGAIGFLSFFCFLRDIHDVRNRSLHPISKFVLCNPRQRFGVPQLLRLNLIQLLQRVQRTAAEVAIHADWIRCVQHGITL